MFTLLEERFLREYYDYLRRIYKGLPSEEDMLKPNNSTIIYMTDKLFLLVHEATKNNTFSYIQYDDENEESIEEITKEETNNTYDFYLNISFISILRDVIIFLFLKNKNISKEESSLLKYIIETNINDVIDQLQQDEALVHKIVELFLKYLMMKHNFYITSEKEEEIIDKYPIIDRLDKNKGYTTINDTIRDILKNIYYDYYDTTGELEKDDYIPKKILIDYDTLLYSDGLNSYLNYSGICTSNTTIVKGFKKYIIKIILADAFLDLKMLQYNKQSYDEDPDNCFTKTEKEVYEFIERAINNNEFMLPTNTEIRHEIYKHYCFYDRNLNCDRKRDLETLIDTDEADKVLALNPICFLE